MVRAVGFFGKESVSYREFMEIFQGWNAHSKWADSYGLKKKILQEFLNQTSEDMEMFMFFQENLAEIILLLGIVRIKLLLLV